MKPYEKSLALDHMKGNAVLFIVVVSIAMLLLIFMISAPKEYIQLERTLDQITYEDDTAYIHFQNDDVDYVFYEFGDVTLDCLQALRPGDVVTVYVFENHQKFTYALISKMTVGDQVLFDSIEHDRIHNQSISVVFLSMLLSSLAAVLVVWLRKTPPLENSKTDIVIKNPRWVLIFALFITTAGLAGFLSYTVLYWLGRIESYPIACVFLFFFLLGSVLLYVYTREKFMLKGGVYTYVKPFKRSRSVSCAVLKCVTIEPGFSISRIVFYDKNDTQVMHFYDDGSAFAGNLFIDSLKAYDIPLVYKHNRHQTH